MEPMVGTLPPPLPPPRTPAPALPHPWPCLHTSLRVSHTALPSLQPRLRNPRMDDNVSTVVWPTLLSGDETQPVSIRLINYQLITRHSLSHSLQAIICAMHVDSTTRWTAPTVLWSSLRTLASPRPGEKEQVVQTARQRRQLCGDEHQVSSDYTLSQD